MLHILITFDYELFFNKAFYTEEEVLIKPTDIICKALKQFDVKGTFFVDTPCIERYYEYGLTEFPLMAQKQINNMLNEGHDIQLHTHPSWYGAEYNNGEWNFDNATYKYDSYKDCKEKIVRAKKTLDNLITAKSAYNCCAYRAGGFCLSPEGELLDTLHDLNIVFDSSVCVGMKNESVSQSFDWGRFKSNKQWFFSPENGLDGGYDKEKVMCEIPVATFSKVPQKYWVTRMQPKLNYPAMKGLRSEKAIVHQTSILKRMSKRVYDSITTPVLFTLDTLHPNALLFMLKHYIQESKMYGEDTYVCLIGHPKFASEESVESLKSFLEMAMKYKDQFDFITFQDAKKRILL